MCNPSTKASLNAAGHNEIQIWASHSGIDHVLLGFDVM